MPPTKKRTARGASATTASPAPATPAVDVSRKGASGGAATVSSTTRKKAATSGKNTGGGKQQQTIVDALNKSALRRKDKGAVRKKPAHEEEKEDMEEDGDDMDVDMDIDDDDDDDDATTLVSKQPVGAKGKLPRLEVDEPVSGDSDQEEKSEERGPRRARVASSQRKSVSESSALDQVLTGSFLLSAGNSSELSRRMKQTWTTLQQLPNQQQDGDAPLEKLRLLCTELLHDKIMEHSEKNVRSLAACCFAELLRVYAPDMPFKSNEELYDAFQLILEQLRCLAIESHEDRGASKATSSTDLHYLYVLESLASVKSCLLLLGMDYTADEQDDPLLVQLFRTLFNTIRKEHSVKIENLMLSIMVSCIEESDSIEQALIDAILSPLVHSNPSIETMGPAADIATPTPESIERGPYHMAQELIRRTSDQLQSHLSHFFNSVLVDAPTSFMTKTSELKEHVYTLIYEVHKINSSLLLYVLPNVCMQLQVDEVATRSEAIALMGRLFASAHAEYGHDYMKNFRDFLGRFRDVSKEIRLQMVQVSAIIWQRKPELASLIEKEFVARLTDPEWEVRRLTVNEVCDLAANNLDAVSEECLRQVGERMKDKRVVLRKETMTGLSQVYAAHVSAYWAPEPEDQDDDEEDEDNDVSLGNVVPTANTKKLGWVPDYVLKCFAYPQQELKLRVIQLLDDILLPKAFTEAVRAKGLLFIYHSLDQSAREALRRVFVERAKCQTLLESFLSARKLSRKASAGSPAVDALLEKAKDAFHSGLTPLFNETENLGKLLEQLVKWKDQTVFKQLELLCECSKTQQDYRNARDRLVKAVGSKSPLGDFLKNFCRKLIVLTVSEGTVATYLRFFIGSGLPSNRENRSVTEILLIVSQTTPQLLASFVQEEVETIMVENAASSKGKDAEADEDDDENDGERDYKVIISILNALAHFSDHWEKRQDQLLDEVDRQATDAMPTDALKNFLKQCCLGSAMKSLSAQDDGAAAKFAAQILANFFGEAKDIGTLVMKLSSKKLLASPSAPTAVSTLHSLHIFAKRCPLQLGLHPGNVSLLWQSLMENFILQQNGEPTKLKKSAKSGFTASKAAEVRCLAIKVAADLLLHCHDGDSANLVERSRELVKLLFELLRSDGRMWSSSGSQPVKYRVAAACNLLKLLRHKKIESALAVSEWHLLGFVMQDSAEEVRRAFVKKLSANLMKNSIPHPHKYLSYLVLGATESNAALKKNARGLLGIAVERMRRVFEATSSRHSSSGNGDDEANEDDRQNVNALMVPEYALPYVIHLLAHHPDFPAPRASKSASSGLRSSLLNDPAWSEQVAYLGFFLDGLMPVNSAEADNIAFLLQILTKLSDCHDSSDSKSMAIYPLIDCAVGLLKRRIKNQSNLKAFPGKIYLPKQLYSAGKASDHRPSNGATREDDAESKSDDAQRSLDPPRKKSRMMSLSPIKPSGVASTFMEMSSPPASAQKRRASPTTSSAKRRKSLLKSPATPSTPAAANSGDEATAGSASASATPSRRQSLMRKARTQAKTFVESSESDDDSDSFVPRASVASRANKRESSGSVVRKSVDAKAKVHEEVDGEDDEGEDMDVDEDEAEESTQERTPQRVSRATRGRAASPQIEEEEEEKTKDGSSGEGDQEEEKKNQEEEEEEEEMTSFRATRRRLSKTVRKT